MMLSKETSPGRSASTLSLSKERIAGKPLAEALFRLLFRTLSLLKERVDAERPGEVPKVLMPYYTMMPLALPIPLSFRPNLL